MPTCELVTIGSELLNGSVLNTNAQFLARRISALHIDVVHQVSCRDKEKEILDALSLAFKRSDLIIATGGLGPTPDDITREAIAKFFRCGLKFDRNQYRHVVNYFKSIRRTTPFITRREAFFPEVAKPLVNRFGIALGFYVEQNGKILIVLPGVPRELINMYESKIQNLIKQKFKVRIPTYILEAHIAGLYETQIMRKLGPQFFKGRAFDFGIYPEIGEVTIRIKTKEKKLVSILRRELSQKLGPSLYSFDGQSLSALIGQKLLQKKWSLAVAESCTGGLLASRITDVPGASRYFKGGVIVYSNQTKHDILRISSERIRTKGAVSREVAKAMAEAARKELGTSLGCSITGIAGPGGGTRAKPVGLVYFGISDSKRTRVFEFQFSGDRAKIRLQAIQKALLILWQWLNLK